MDYLEALGEEVVLDETDEDTGYATATTVLLVPRSSFELSTAMT